MGCVNSKKDKNEDRAGKLTRDSRGTNSEGVSQPKRKRHVQQKHQELNQVTVDLQRSSADRKRNAVTLQPTPQQETQNPSGISQIESQQITLNQNISRQLNKDCDGETKDISDKDMAQILIKNKTKTNKLASKPQQQQSHKENTQNKNSNQYYNRPQSKKENTPLISPDPLTNNNLKLDQSISASNWQNETTSKTYLTSGLLATTKNTTCPRKDIPRFTNKDEGKYQHNRNDLPSDLPTSKRLKTKIIIHDKISSDGTRKETEDANRNFKDIILSTNPLLQKQPQMNIRDEQRRCFQIRTVNTSGFKPSSEDNRSSTNIKGPFSLSPGKDVQMSQSTNCKSYSVVLASSPGIPIILATNSGSQFKNNNTSPKLESNAQYTTESIDVFERSNQQTVQSKHVTENVPTTSELIGKSQDKVYVDEEDFIRCHVEGATNFTTPKNPILSNTEYPEQEYELEKAPDEKISNKAFNAVIHSLEQIEQKALLFVTEIENFTELEDSNKYYYIEESLRRLIDKLDDMFDDIGNVNDLREKRKAVYKRIFPLFDKLDDKVQENKQRIENAKSQSMDRRQTAELNNPSSGFQAFQTKQQEHEHQENLASGVPYNAKPQVVKKSNEQFHKHYQDAQENRQITENGQTEGQESEISNIHHNELKSQIIKVGPKQQFDKLDEQQEQANQNRQITKHEQPYRIETNLQEEPYKTTYPKTELKQEKVVDKENGQAQRIEHNDAQYIFNSEMYDSTNECQKLSVTVKTNWAQNENEKAEYKDTRYPEGLRDSTEDKNGVQISHGENNVNVKPCNMKSQLTVNYDKPDQNYQGEAQKIETSL